MWDEFEKFKNTVKLDNNLVSNDSFGDLYQLFLAKKGNSVIDGEYYTPKPIVSILLSLIKPNKGLLLDPSCGTGGMFVQCAELLNTSDLTFYGIEKNELPAELARLNLKNNNMNGTIVTASTYYKDPLDMVGKFDFILANPPYNVKDIDAIKLRQDTRLPFGMPPFSSKQKILNGNYLWLSYFYSYLNEHGKAACVMPSQTSAGSIFFADYKKKLIESQSIEMIIALSRCFFKYTSVPCELWIIDKNVNRPNRDKVLFINMENYKVKNYSIDYENEIMDIVNFYRNNPESTINIAEKAKSIKISDLGKNNYWLTPRFHIDIKEQEIIGNADERLMEIDNELALLEEESIILRKELESNFGNHTINTFAIG
jgi:type I restriction enzyme M protein